LRKKNWIGSNPTQLFFFGLGWAQIFGWAIIGPAMNSALHCSQTTWTVESKEERWSKRKKKGRGKGWPAVAATIGCTTGGDKRRRWWFAVAATSSLSFYFFFFVLLVFRPLSLFFFSFFFLFFRYSRLSLLCSLRLFSLCSPPLYL